MKRKYESHDFLYQNEVSKNGTLAGKIFEKDLKIQKLTKAIEIIKQYSTISCSTRLDDNEECFIYCNKIISKEEYEALKEVIGNEK